VMVMHSPVLEVLYGSASLASPTPVRRTQQGAARSTTLRPQPAVWPPARPAAANAIARRLYAAHKHARDARPPRLIPRAATRPGPGSAAVPRPHAPVATTRNRGCLPDKRSPLPAAYGLAAAREASGAPRPHRGRSTRSESSPLPPAPRRPASCPRLNELCRLLLPPPQPTAASSGAPAR